MPPKKRKAPTERKPPPSSHKRHKKSSYDDAFAFLATQVVEPVHRLCFNGLMFDLVTVIVSYYGSVIAEVREQKYHKCMLWNETPPSTRTRSRQESNDGFRRTYLFDETLLYPLYRAEQLYCHVRDAVRALTTPRYKVAIIGLDEFDRWTRVPFQQLMRSSAIDDKQWRECPRLIKEAFCLLCKYTTIREELLAFHDATIDSDTPNPRPVIDETTTRWKLDKEKGEISDYSGGRYSLNGPEFNKYFGENSDTTATSVELYQIDKRRCDLVVPIPNHEWSRVKNEIVTNHKDQHTWRATVTLRFRLFVLERRTSPPADTADIR